MSTSLELHTSRLRAPSKKGLLPSLYTLSGPISVQSIYQKKKGCFDSIWLPQFHTSSASLNTSEIHCLLYIPNSD